MRKKLKVLFLESQPTLPSDSQVHALLMRNYDRDRVEVYVACNPSINGTMSQSFHVLGSIPGVSMLPLALGPKIGGRSRVIVAAGVPSALVGFVQLAKFIRRNRIDVIHASSRPRDAVYAVILGKVTGARSLIHLHVMCADWFGTPIRWALRRCDAILAISNFVAQSALSAGYPSDKMYCALNGVDTSDWDPEIDGTDIRREFGIEPDAPLLAIVSRLFYWKGHTLLFHALSLVRGREPSVKLMVVGENDSHAHPGGGSYLDELKRLACELDLTDNVIFTGFRSDVQRILAACDVYTMPSYEEPLGLAFLEAMAMQKPVIALDSGGVPEVVEHGKSGLLSKPDDDDALAANILSLIQQPDVRRTMGAFGRRHVEQHHNPRQMADQTEGIYRRVLHATP